MNIKVDIEILARVDEFNHITMALLLGGKLSEIFAIKDWEGELNASS